MRKVSLREMKLSVEDCCFYPQCPCKTVLKNNYDQLLDQFNQDVWAEDPCSLNCCVLSKVSLVGQSVWKWCSYVGVTREDSLSWGKWRWGATPFLLDHCLCLQDSLLFTRTCLPWPAAFAGHRSWGSASRVPSATSNISHTCEYDSWEASD